MSIQQVAPSRSMRTTYASSAVADKPLDLDQLSPDAFKAAFRNHAAGVSVVTADAGNGPVALTATSVFSVSVEPPLFVFSLSDLSSSSPTIAAADTVVVHLLAADQLDIATLCATSGVDRFADASMWSRLATGEPVFHGARRWIRGRIVDRMQAGNSTVVAVRALESGGSMEQCSGAPLVYFDRTWHRLDEKSQIDV